MKIAICTIFDPVPNYGNKLQNYAIAELLQKRNIEYVTLVSEKKKHDYLAEMKIFIKRILRFELKYYYLFYKKKHIFKKFDIKYLNPNYDFIKNNLNINEYNYFIVGSDQVWNATWFNGTREILFLLTFAKSEQKISFAPSFGLSELPDQWKEYFRKYLNDFKYLSVRENEGKKIIEELIDRKAEVIVDPTLLLSKNEWKELSAKSKNNIRKKNDKYILKYFLGKELKENIEYIEKVGKDNNFKIIELNNYKHANNFLSGPCEFVDLIENAELVCTDSFHACVFSIIFNKPFLVFDRDGTGAGMNSRIDTLLTKLNLNRKKFCKVKENSIFEHNYEDTYKLLEKEKRKALEFLDRSIGNSYEK